MQRIVAAGETRLHGNGRGEMAMSTGRTVERCKVLHREQFFKVGSPHSSWRGTVDIPEIMQHATAGAAEMPFGPINRASHGHQPIPLHSIARTRKPSKQTPQEAGFEHRAVHEQKQTRLMPRAKLTGQAL